MNIITWFAGAKIKILEWAAGIGVVIAGIAYVFLKGRSDGEAAGKLDAAQQTAKENTDSLQQLQKAVKVSADVDTAITALPPDAPIPIATPGVVLNTVAAQPDAPIELDKANPDSAAGRLNALATGGIVFLCVWLSACTPQVITKVDYCGTWKPIIPNSKDLLTQGTSNQLLDYDCRGYRLNCWDPPGIAIACKNIGGK